jgi:hypothetical protein
MHTRRSEIVLHKPVWLERWETEDKHKLWPVLLATGLWPRVVLLCWFKPCLHQQRYYSTENYQQSAVLRGLLLSPWSHLHAAWVLSATSIHISLLLWHNICSIIKQRPGKWLKFLVSSDYSLPIGCILSTCHNELNHWTLWSVRCLFCIFVLTLISC